MEILRELVVPLTADPVLSPEVRYGASQAVVPCILFPFGEEDDCVGRVTFEGLDALRCCRGEYLPYDYVHPPGSPYPWVFEVDNSAWLQQRHEYEYLHYRTSLLEEYVHYLFRFHDEFVELIAKGIWLDKIKYDHPGAANPGHPLLDLSHNLPAEEFVVEGIRCSVRHNQLSHDQLMEQSRLCSQIVFQYFLTLDGQTKPSYAAKLRTAHGRSTTRLRAGLFHNDLYTVEGLGQEALARKSFASWVSEIAARRRRMGKPG